MCPPYEECRRISDFKRLFVRDAINFCYLFTSNVFTILIAEKNLETFKTSKTHILLLLRVLKTHLKVISYLGIKNPTFFSRVRFSNEVQLPVRKYGRFRGYSLGKILSQKQNFASVLKTLFYLLKLLTKDLLRLTRLKKTFLPRSLVRFDLEFQAIKGVDIHFERHLRIVSEAIRTRFPEQTEERVIKGFCFNVRCSCPF